MGLTSPHLTGAPGVTTSALAAGLSLMPLTWREFACRSWPLITDAEYLLMQAGAAGLPEPLPSSTDAHPHYSTSTFSLTYVSNPQQQPAKEAVVAMLQYQAAILGGQVGAVWVVRYS
ncbi:hypothetical protein HaLaN_01307 [Haematococcus lacustris]|uniref:Uncharacterized protein n=1 Tax=Haematococcus lacustris TaxID=44745 RepID=A0A699YUE9_HAELA|nr:hypothetical protein HaLaN_01307 [Haematococcus lacustris]